MKNIISFLFIIMILTIFLTACGESAEDMEARIRAEIEIEMEEQRLQAEAEEAAHAAAIATPAPEPIYLTHGQVSQVDPGVYSITSEYSSIDLFLFWERGRRAAIQDVDDGYSVYMAATRNANNHIQVPHGEQVYFRVREDEILISLTDDPTIRIYFVRGLDD